MKSSLFPALEEYFARVEKSPFAGDGDRRVRLAEFARWIRERIESRAAAEAIVVCTGNSRRSVFGAALGNALAHRLSIPLRFASGGTAPSAVNPRAIAALLDAGFQIEPTGDLAPPGEEGLPNKIYRVRWSDASPGALEFSKRYDDRANPRASFAALMVCDEAQRACPMVMGAAIRLPVPFSDPKSSDGTPEETSAYRSRRDEIAGAWWEALRQV